MQRRCAFILTGSPRGPRGPTTPLGPGSPGSPYKGRDTKTEMVKDSESKMFLYAGGSLSVDLITFICFLQQQIWNRALMFSYSSFMFGQINYTCVSSNSRELSLGQCVYKWNKAVMEEISQIMFHSIPCDQELLFFPFLRLYLGFLRDPGKQNIRSNSFSQNDLLRAHDFLIS